MYKSSKYCLRSISNISVSGQLCIITIFPSPEASFYANEVCLGDSTIFINTSSPSNNWSWDFGDGLANYLSSNPNHLYSQKDL